MDTLAAQPILCPSCQTINLPGSLFCSQCGAKLAEKNESISLGKKLYIYAVSLLLPPLGLIWTFKYLSSPSKRTVAIVAAVLTVISTIVTIWFTMGIIQDVQSQLSSFSNLGL